MAQSIRGTITHILKFTWSLFLNGLLAILPITLSVAIFVFSFRILISWLQPLSKLLIRYAHALPGFLQAIPHSEILLAILGILAIGALMKFFIIESFTAWIEQLLGKIPLFNSVYSGVKRLVQAFNPKDRTSFKTVVIVEFPRKGMYSVGFLTSYMQPEHAPNKEITFANVFIPTTPNPTTGYFLVVPKDELIVLDISRQEAMALIISGGIIQPKKKQE